MSKFMKAILLGLLLSPVLSQANPVKDAVVNRLMLHFISSDSLVRLHYKGSDAARACYAIGQLEGLKAATYAVGEKPVEMIVGLSNLPIRKVYSKLEKIDDFKNSECEI